ncbi:MAG: class I SAM-dependent methyltransferase [Bryobacteraceae bacterium]
MRILAIPSLLAFAISVCLAGDGGSTQRQKALAQLGRMVASQRGMMNIAPAEGEYLSNLVVKLNAKRVLEIGTSHGYSGIWLALGLSQTGGKLITLDIDRGRYDEAVENFRLAGLSSYADLRLADALKEVPKIDGPFDLVFIDAWKPDYVRYLKMVLSKMRPGGAIAAHNVRSQASEMEDFLEEIRTNPALKTEFITLGPSGLSISYVR